MAGYTQYATDLSEISNPESTYTQFILNHGDSKHLFQDKHNKTQKEYGQSPHTRPKPHLTPPPEAQAKAAQQAVTFVQAPPAAVGQCQMQQFSVSSAPQQYILSTAVPQPVVAAASDPTQTPAVRPGHPKFRTSITVSPKVSVSPLPASTPAHVSILPAPAGPALSYPAPAPTATSAPAPLPVTAPWRPPPQLLAQAEDNWIQAGLAWHRLARGFAEAEVNFRAAEAQMVSMGLQPDAQKLLALSAAQEGEDDLTE